MVIHTQYGPPNNGQIEPSHETKCVNLQTNPEERNENANQNPFDVKEQTTNADNSDQDRKEQPF
jgi:hypothetical protein